MFLFAGHETTAGTLHWALRLLARHPEAQQKARQEIREVLGDRDELASEDLPDLDFCLSIFKETLRLYPATKDIAKLAPRDTTLGGVSVPAGAAVAMHFDAVHRHPRYWQDPNAFRPERFQERNAGDVVPYSWVPFSNGARGCIGNRFAQMEGALVLAKVLQRYNVCLPPDAPEDGELFRGEVVVTHKPGVPVMLVLEAL